MPQNIVPTWKEEGVQGSLSQKMPRWNIPWWLWVAIGGGALALLVGGLCCWFVVVRRRRFREREAAEEWQHTQEAQWQRLGDKAAAVGAGVGAGAAAGAAVGAAGLAPGSRGHPASRRHSSGLVNSRPSRASSPHGSSAKQVQGAAGASGGAAAAAGGRPEQQGAGGGSGHSPGGSRHHSPHNHRALRGGNPRGEASVTGDGASPRTHEGPNAPEVLVLPRPMSRQGSLKPAPPKEPAAAGQWWAGGGEITSTPPRTAEHAGKQKKGQQPAAAAKQQQGQERGAAAGSDWFGAAAAPRVKVPQVDLSQILNANWEAQAELPGGLLTSKRRNSVGGMLGNLLGRGSAGGADAAAPAAGAGGGGGTASRTAREAAHANRERSEQLDEVATLPETWVGGAPAAGNSIAAEFQRQQERKARKKKKHQQQ